MERGPRVDKKRNDDAPNAAITSSEGFGSADGKSVLQALPLGIDHGLCGGARPFVDGHWCELMVVPTLMLTPNLASGGP